MNNENKNNEQAHITHVHIIKSKPNTKSNVKIMKAYKFKKKNKKHGATAAMLKNKGHTQSAPSRTSEETKNKKGRIKIKEQDLTQRTNRTASPPALTTPSPRTSPPPPPRPAPSHADHPPTHPPPSPFLPYPQQIRFQVIDGLANKRTCWKARATLANTNTKKE